VIILETERLILRNWKQSDRDLFREINADSKVMEFFPFRRTYEESDAVLEKLNSMITETGLGFYAMALKETDEPMGFCGLSLTNLPGIFPEGMVEIGWRLATRFWGNGYVTEAALALLDEALVNRRMKAVVSFAVAENRRSTAVMERIGMQRQPWLDFTHPRVPDTHPHLKQHVVYAAAAELWSSPQKETR